MGFFSTLKKTKNEFYNELEIEIYILIHKYIVVESRIGEGKKRKK